MAGFDLSLLLSLPMVFHSAWISFEAPRARCRHTLDVMAAVAVAPAGWLYSLAVTPDRW